MFTFSLGCFERELIRSSTKQMSDFTKIAVLLWASLLIKKGQDREKVNGWHSETSLPQVCTRVGYFLFSTIRKMMENNSIIDANHAGGNKQFMNSNHLPSNFFLITLSVY